MKKNSLFFVTLILSLGWWGCTHSPLQTFTDSSAVQSTEAVVRSQASIADSDMDENWAYDPGPESTAMGKKLIDIVATQPHMPSISMELTGDQMFRPAFGPTLWRMIQKPNSIKILFIGQDGTHIAEAAGRTATAGFGGRAQDLAAYFGVRTGAAFINTFAFTIQGQYSAFGTPVFSESKGKHDVSFGAFTDNGTWLMAQDQKSPMVKWRNSLIDWIITNNKDSLKMIVLFGGSARDSIATFIESKGGKVGARYTPEEIADKKIQVPMIKIKGAGGNSEFVVLLDKEGKDLYQGIVDEPLNYKEAEDQKLAQDTLDKEVEEVYPRVAFLGTGLNGSGIIHPAQIGGYDLDKIFINGQKTLSIQGLQLMDGSKLDHDVILADFPHPTALSRSEMEKKGSASIKVREALKDIQEYVDKGWVIQADPGMVNEFAQKKPYTYGRTDIGPAYYEFGTPKNRMVSVSTAVRLSKLPGYEIPNGVLIGSTKANEVAFDKKEMMAMTKAQPAPGISDDEMFTARPRTAGVREIYDHGPGEKFAKIMKENIDLSIIGKKKSGGKPDEKCFDPEDSSEFNVKTHPACVADHGHYRGTFNNPKVIILADPDGFDEILTSKALSGTRGQYLHGLMEDMGIKDQYLVLRTVPFGMDDATAAEWKVVLSQTKAYRQKLFKALMENKSSLQLVIADGPYAAQEIKSLVSSDVKVVNIDRKGTENNYGLKEAAVEIAKLPAFKNLKADLEMANIPRSHLGFMSRVWEGTSGSRVLNASAAPYQGYGFAILVPAWAFEQKPKQEFTERQAIERLQKVMEVQNLPYPNESYEQFRQRLQSKGLPIQ